MRFSNWQNKATALWLVLLLMVFSALAVAWYHKDIRIQTDIFALLPEVEQDQDLARIQQHVNQQLNEQIVVVLDAKQQQQLNQATALLGTRISQSGLFQPLKAQVDPEQFGKTLFQHHAALLDTQDIQALQQQDYALIQERALLQLFTPGMPISAELLQSDPLLFFPRYAMTLGATQAASEIKIEQGFATIEDQQGYSRLINIGLTQSAFNIDYQEKTADWIAQTNAALAPLGVKANWTGSLIFAHNGTTSAKQEISTIGLGSTLGVILLVWFGFRSLRPMLTEFIAAGSGCLVAFAVTHLIFSEIHLMTLVFGASLIGVAVDFSFYFMALQSQQKHVDGFEVLKPILPSLFMGLVTTLVAYVFLSFTPFPGFKQIAVFSMVGLSCAWISSILLLPRLKALNAEPAIRSLAFMGQLRSMVQQRQPLRYGLMLGIAVIGLSSLAFLKSNDDVRNLQSLNPELQQQDQYIRNRFGQQQSGDYLVIRGDNPADLQQREQDVLQKLKALQQQGALSAVQAIGQSIPSLAQQQQNIALLQAIPTTFLTEYAQSMQLEPRAVLAWQAQLGQQSLLSLSQFAAHPLRFLAPSETERLIMLQGIQDVAALQALESAEIRLVRPVESLSQLFHDHRIQAQYLIFFAWLALIFGLGMVYGRAAVFALVAPVTLALITTFAIQAWLGVEINLFSLMGVFLIMGIGVDYAIFYRHGHQHPQVVSMALFLCMMSTFLGFGLLALSQTYAIFSFGITVLCGVVFAYLYATLFTPADSGLKQSAS